MKHISPFLITLFALCIGVANVWAETVIYKVSSTTAVTTSGAAPTGSSASYSQTYNTISQMTSGNSATLTLSGFAGQKVTGIVLSMKSNSSKGTGTFSAIAGSTTIASIASATTFNKWYDNTSYGTSYRDVTVTLTNSDYAIQTGENVVIKIAATVNSLYIQSYTITYESAGSSCTQLAKPTGLNASTTAYNAATLTWSAVEKATKYQVTITPNGGTAKTDEATETTYAATDLAPETTYTWTVKAIGDGSTYCDSEESQTGDFTTPAKPKYTITWSTPTGTSTTKVTQDDKVVLPTTNPAAPVGCSDKVFMGWSATNIGTTGTDNAPEFITAETVPAGDVTYYAVFATKEGSDLGEEYEWKSDYSDWGESENNWLRNNNAPLPTLSYTPTYKVAKIVLNVRQSNTTGSNSIEVRIGGKTFGDIVSSLSGTTAYDIVFVGTEALLGKVEIICTNKSASGTKQGTFYLNSITLYEEGVSYTDYVTNCVDCSAPATPLALSVAEATLNLGEGGTAMTTFSTTGGNGAEIVYSLIPEVGSAISDDVLTFTKAGTYTLTASQDLNTTDGTTYCGSRDSETITVTKNPVWNLTSNLVPFATTCTEASAAQEIHLSGYNLSADVKASLQSNSAFSLSANQTDWSKSITLPIENGKVDATIYVRLDKSESCPAAATNQKQGTVTISSTGITALTQPVSGTISAPSVKVYLNDQEVATQITGQRLCCQIEEQTLKDKLAQINCEDAHFSHFVTDPTQLETPVVFPYDITTTDDITFYAVYCKETSFSKTQYRKGTVDDLTDGQKVVIVEYTDEKALSSEATEDTYNLTAKDVSLNNDEITIADESIVWTVTTSGEKYKFSQGENYLNVISTTSGSKTYYNLKCTATEDEFSVEEGGSGYTLESTNLSGRYIEYFNGKFTTYTDGNENSYYMQFYVPAANCTYVLKPCGPYIKATGDIAITSGKGIWVESVTPLTISAKNLDKNEDGGAAAVTITATVTDEAAAKGFSIKTQGTQNNGAKSVTLASGLTDATYDGSLIVVYTPKEDNVTVEGKIALRVYKSGGSTTYATDTIVVRGRSLPAEFVIAAETKNGWVALPSDLAVGSTGTLKYSYAISVDNDAAPTKATEAPETAIWLADARSTVNAAATAIRLKNAQGKHLQGSTAKDETNVWLSDQNSEQAQSWELRGADFEHYFVRMQASEEGRYLSYDATKGKIGNYKQESSLRILPVEKTCVRFDAPELNVHKITSNAVTLQWEAIAGVADYEYSLDDGSTWQTCTGVQTMGTAIQWILSGLTAETKYTISVRAKAADGKTNCSDAKEVTATTTGCDDVPTDLWTSATANSVTIMWNAIATTATIKIYSDEKGENEVQSVSDMTSPAKITGLEANTHYYYQVFANGTCGSAIENFWTESNEVSIVEWKKEAVVVDINTDVSDADEVSILVENQTTHGSNNKNIADDLFFSKYYEATGNVKLIGIYNGTKDTLSLANMYIYLGVTSWNANEISLSKYGRKKYGYIAPNEEIILWYTQDKGEDIEIISCAKKKMDMDIMDKNSSVSFSGRQTFALVRGSDIIDIMGAIDTNGKEVEDVSPIEGNCIPNWGDITESGAKNRTWCGTGYSIEDKTTEIQLSMNRCLLVRSNKVKSGANAVANNVGAFNTLTKDEWLGRQVLKGNDNGVTESCEGFAYVADFNYNDYYTTYDSVGKLEIKGNRNPDGTYTIPVNRLDTMACTNLRLQLKKNGTLIASKEYKVPIVVEKSILTNDADYFGGDKRTDEICATCDVVVRDKAQLTHTAGGKQQFRDMYIYAGSRLSIPAEQKMTLDKVRMFAQNDSVSYAIINNGDASDATITVKEVSHVKRIDGKYWYPFSLPYDCNIADIDQLSGQDLGVYGEDWGIKYYDGKKRQSDGNSTTHYGEVSKYWTMMPEDGVLKAYTGYIIGLFVPAADEALMKSVNFPPANTSAYTESAEAKTTPITNWPDNLTAQKRHHGWNFVGSPYISLFGVASDEGLYDIQLKMGWTDELGEQQDKEYIYVSIPNGGNSNTYTQAQASGVILKPFTAYFVQAIDPKNGQSNTLDLTYSKSNRRLLAPARAQEATPLILAELDIRCGALHDNAGVLVSDTYSADYEIGDDLYKMYAAEGKPQLYTTDARNDKMAYQALPDLLAHAVPLGIYVPAAGDYTLSLNRSLSRLAMADAVYLLHNGSVVADLLRADYTLSATARGTLGGYTLDIRRAPKMPTSLDPTNGDAPYLILRDGVLTIANLPAEATIQVYDVLGRLLLRTTATEPSLSVPAVQTGVYTVLITTDQQQTVLKTLCR